MVRDQFICEPSRWSRSFKEATLAMLKTATVCARIVLTDRCYVTSASLNRD